VTKYKVDGVFANRWAPQGGGSYCVHCERNFREATGAALPRTTDPRDPGRRQFLFPVGSLRVRVRLPAQTRARRVHLLTAGTSPCVEESGNVLTVIVPSVDVHEVVAIDF
jgi:hypothetical protein